MGSSEGEPAGRGEGRDSALVVGSRRLEGLDLRIAAAQHGHLPHFHDLFPLCLQEQLLLLELHARELGRVARLLDRQALALHLVQAFLAVLETFDARGFPGTAVSLGEDG